MRIIFPNSKPEIFFFFRGTSWRSYLVFLRDDGNREFSHVGLIKVENGIPYLIHATPIPYGQHQHGIVIKERLKEDFYASNRILQTTLFRLRSDESKYAENASFIASDYAQRAVLFDHDFNLLTTDKVYCTELIWLAFKEAGIQLLDEAIGRNSILFPSRLSQSKYLREIERF